jgi:hypothetical protein
MSFKGEFADILKEKLGEPAQTEAPKETKNTYVSRSIDWILPIFAPRRTWTPQQIPGAYPKVVVTKRKSTKPQPSSHQQEKVQEKEETISLSSLSTKAKKAHGILVKLGAEFNEDTGFRASELKTQYRKLARTYHPDSQSVKASNKYFNMVSVCYKFISKELAEKNH